MALVTLPNLGPDPFTVNASVLNGKVDPLATDYNGNIQNVNIAAGAGIVYSKLSLTDSILNADVNSSAAIVASKLLLSGIAQTVSYTGAAENWAKGADIASATTTDIGAATGNSPDVTGTTTITGLGTVQAGTVRNVRFTGILTLTHNGTSLILPTGANITTAAGDTATFISLGSGNWYCKSFQRKDGTALVGVTAATALSGSTIQTVLTQSSAVATDSGTAVIDDSTPTTTECPIISALDTAITASSASNTLIITTVLNVSIKDTVDIGVAAIFLDAGTNAIDAAMFLTSPSDQSPTTVIMQFKINPADTNAHTYKLGLGGVNGVITLNGRNAGRIFGGVLYSSMKIEEIKA